MRWERLLLGRRGRKAAALTLSLSLLNQQGLLVSEACGQVVRAGQVPSGVRVAPVVTGAPAAAAPNLAPLGASPISLTPSLSLPSPVSPNAVVSVAAKPAAVIAARTPEVIAFQAQIPTPSPAAIPAAAPTFTLPSSAGERSGMTADGKGERTAAAALAAAVTGLKERPAASLNLAFDGERAKDGADAVPASGGKAPSRPALAPAPKRGFVEFNAQYLRDLKKHFLESATKPNKQDYWFLATKTFGLNLAIRVAFAAKGVAAGDLGLARAILSTAWYQAQDAVFTVFGQTYMKFLGKMTGLLRVGNAKVGDLLFVYTQLVAFEFLNRLVLGPIGENPLVYSWGGIGLLFLNNLQGMVSGGLLIPVINKLRAAGWIGERTSNYLYQAASLTMHLGLLATFGYQTLFTVLTTALMILSWSAYIGLSFFAKPKPGLEPKL